MSSSEIILKRIIYSLQCSVTCLSLFRHSFLDNFLAGDWEAEAKEDNSVYMESCAYVLKVDGNKEIKEQQEAPSFFFVSPSEYRMAGSVEGSVIEDEP